MSRRIIRRRVARLVGHVARDGDDERERDRDVVSRASARRRARLVGRDANSRRRRSIETDDETDDAFVSRARR